jgi:hypothetical protein
MPHNCGKVMLKIMHYSYSWMSVPINGSFWYCLLRCRYIAPSQITKCHDASASNKRQNCNRLQMIPASRCYISWIWHEYSPSLCSVHRTPMPRTWRTRSRTNILPSTNMWTASWHLNSVFSLFHILWHWTFTRRRYTRKWTSFMQLSMDGI